ncbi:cellobiose phosphorylase [Vibrio sp. SM6]|uniref:Cellobiose phosphorylase n=1 Tax=Vibrio agarilyticus TaxID=2726741 RepID=A0A7X8YHT7_9VIBR|nr:cellobiose phosphorylase [Vibrio agarilyticus]NLS14049.1 cellobiose phosphorylase [Vibrio agarilyticus]
MTKEYYLENEEFVINDYDLKKTFSSFLPGLAGKKGIPLWAFYVNRGQGLCSFGVENKDNPILEFSPAVTAYQNVSRVGFRTFAKMDGQVYEFFGSERCENTTRKMHIKRGQFKITEENRRLGLMVQVTYFGLPNDNLAAIMRKVEITDLSGAPRSFELLDGISQILPFGTPNALFKEMSNLLRSWMDVFNMENQVPFFKMRSTTSDSAEVGTLDKGNFYLSFANERLITPIVDGELVFGHDNSMTTPVSFARYSLAELAQREQVTANKIPVGFTPVDLTLGANETFTLRTIIGHAHDVDLLNAKVATMVSSAYFDEKERESETVINELVKDVACQTANPLFDEYIKQNYLDNILRGGYPLVFESEEKNHVYHVFSRKHGDLERDYNFFNVAPEYFSQGNGNFRDVCQNRRVDSLFNPKVGDFNVLLFASLIQLDGYNPLGVNGSTFELVKGTDIHALVEANFVNGHDVMRDVLAGKFTPGVIINTMANQAITSNFDDMTLLANLLKHADQNIEASFGEGFWVDHWTYILDLVEAHLAVNPDTKQALLFDNHDYKYYSSPVTVLPRDEKTVITKSGEVRRYGSLMHNDDEKIKRLGMDVKGSNWAVDSHGDVLKTNLFSKLFTLAFNKFTTLDPEGIGIEMESDKPGWNDAMNGLPGLFGSGVSESVELLRLVTFLQQEAQAQGAMRLPAEFTEYVAKVDAVLNSETSGFAYWDAVSSLRESYRDAVRFTVVSNDEHVNVSDVTALLGKMAAKLEQGLEKAQALCDGVLPTFLYFEATQHQPIMEDGAAKIGHYGLPLTKVEAFKLHVLPRFLEAPARMLKISTDMEANRAAYGKIKATEIYDQQLGQFKTSECLNEMSLEIGRARAFTKGWLERESNFLHMNYKFLLGLLKSGMHQEFFNEIQTNLVCFMDPEVYGRSILENSSFIAPTCNPDPMVHGQGFVARLSGSTVEMLHMWTLMMFGDKPFIMQNDALTLNLQPALPAEFFDANNEVSFCFLGSTKVTYVNSARVNTFDAFNVSEYELTFANGERKVVNSVIGEDAQALRRGDVAELRVIF